MIALCPNPYRDENLKLTKRAEKLLNDAGFETTVKTVFTDEKIGDLSKIDMLIVIGGDGTILSVVAETNKSGIPILGVNLGTKGFMTSLEADNIDLIVQAARGEYEISERMMLDVFRNGEYVASALNDAVIHGYGDCILLNVKCDSTTIGSISGDGIILSTPTGSTGYSLSAGGPIVEPVAKSIIISPICAHSIGSKSFVLDSKRTVSIDVQRLHDKKAYLSVDGRNAWEDLNTEDNITVKTSSYTIKMVDLGVKSFYETAFEKLT